MHIPVSVRLSASRTWTYGISQITSMILNMAFLDPLFLFLLRTTMGTSLATEIAMLLPSIVILVLFFKGKFVAKPKFSMYCNKFHKETWEALKIGFSALIMNLSYVIPSLFLMKYVTIRATWVGEYESVVAVYSSIARIHPLSFSVPIALVAAYLPATSYAFGRKDLKRIVVYICIIYCAIITLIMVSFPKQIAMIFSKSEGFTKWAKRLYPICFYAFICSNLKFILIAFLQATQQNIKYIVASIIMEILSAPIYSIIFHYTTKNKSPEIILYAYVTSDVMASIICALFALPYLITCWKNRNNPVEEQNDNTDIDNEESDDNKIIPEI